MPSSTVCTFTDPDQHFAAVGSADLEASSRARKLLRWTGVHRRHTGLTASRRR